MSIREGREQEVTIVKARDSNGTGDPLYSLSAEVPHSRVLKKKYSSVRLRMSITISLQNLLF